MLIKIDEIKEVGRFSSLKHKAPQFPNLSLLFARNGYGKSTICAVLRSASEVAPNYIASRKRLGTKGDPSVKTTWSAGPVTFTNGKWAGATPPLLVFDQEYVQRNLHVGDSVTRDNKRSLLPIILGEQGVLLAKKISALDAAQRENREALKVLANQIKGHHPAIENVSTYAQVAIPEDIDERIAAAARSVELARQTVAVREKPKPRKIETSSLSSFVDACSRTLGSVSEDAADQVRAHIEHHNLGASADRWLKFGVDHHAGSCPFCNQSTAGVALVDALTAYYSAAFEELIGAVEAATKALSSITQSGERHWRVVVERNASDFSFWGSVAELPETPTLSPDQQREIEAGLDKLEAMLRQKAASPLSAVDVLADPMVTSAFAAIDAYNQSLDICDEAIERAKKSVEFASLEQASTQSAKLIALGARRSQPMIELAAAYVSAEKDGKKLTDDKSEAQRELTTYAPLTIEAKQAEINALLRSFGTDFQIVDAKANFVGREPNTDFAIAIGQAKVTAGEKSDNEPSFKTVLSTGDKVTLALAFFIVQVLGHKLVKDAVVVFDDPFNSQDMGRQWETTSQIRAIAKVAAQVFVLSHDPRFLNMIEKDAPAGFGSYQIQCDAPTGEGAIYQWSSAEELKAEYVRRAEILREYANHGRLLKDQTTVSVQMAIRPFLEDYIRARFPARFPDPLRMLDGMTDEIEAAGVSDPLYAHVTTLRALNEYSRGSMHGGAQGPDPAALRGQCQKVIDIVGSY